ncbi:MAG: hypothetical protein FLDDKLPJ_00359 [Phycisphaerae bacterium]|nr:hypothetical protein [Phycisphaerae bacterium]
MMNEAPLHVVTGAFGYTGRALTERLLSDGVRVRTLTNSPLRAHPFGDRVEVHPLALGDAERLTASLRGADVLFNTYWVRFNHRLFNFEQAVANTKALFSAAQGAGVRRVVHVSVLRADEADDLGYYRGKHALEAALRASGLSHAIVRPAVLFGRGDILINNIAWTLRRMPFAGVFGDGRYGVRPLHVDEMAEVMIDAAGRAENVMIDAVGPERFQYPQLLTALAEILGLRRRLVRVPKRVGWLVGRALGPFIGDVILTWEEILALTRGLLDCDSPATGAIRLTDWAREHRDTLGVRYAGEIPRRIHRSAAYEAL